MAKMVWRGSGLVPVDSKSTPAPVRTPEPIPAPEPEDTMVDPHPPVVDEPHGSEDAGEPKTDEEKHDEEHGMTEEEINKIPTEEPKEFWSIRKVGIGIGALVVLMVIVVSIASGSPYILGLLSLGCAALTAYCFYAVVSKGGAVNRLAYVVVGVLSLITMIALWAAMASGSSPTGPYQ